MNLFTGLCLFDSELFSTASRTGLDQDDNSDQESKCQLPRAISTQSYQTTYYADILFVVLFMPVTYLSFTTTHKHPKYLKTETSVSRVG